MTKLTTKQKATRRTVVTVTMVIGLFITLLSFFAMLWINGLISTGVIEANIFGFVSWHFIVAALFVAFGLYLIVDSTKVMERLKESNKWN